MFDFLKKAFSSNGQKDNATVGITAQPVDINPPKHQSKERLLRRLERLYQAQQRTPSDDINQSITVTRTALEAMGHKKLVDLAAVRKQLKSLKG